MLTTQFYFTHQFETLLSSSGCTEKYNLTFVWHFAALVLRWGFNEVYLQVSLTIIDTHEDMSALSLVWPLLFYADREIENIGSSYTETNSFAVCSATKIFPDHLDEGRNRGSPIIRTDSPSRKKGVVFLPAFICQSTSFSRC